MKDDVIKLLGFVRPTVQNPEEVECIIELNLDILEARTKKVTK